MSTGIETWNMNLLDIGAMYPFPGSEVLWAIIGIVSWLLWHWIQIRAENKIYDEDEQIFSDKATLNSAMQLSNAETLTEPLKAHADGLKQP